MKKAAILLSGCGVYDGAEIHESVFTLLALKQHGIDYHCFAPNKRQMHVVNHISGDEMAEERNVLTESARIARGAISDLSELRASDYDALVIPGGFGAAKNLNQWAVKGPEGEIDPEVKKAIKSFKDHNKAILALCMGPTVVSQALSGESAPTLTVGSTAVGSPYDIAAISAGMEQLGTKVDMKTLKEVCVDKENRIVSAPCYMLDGDITDIHDNIQLAVKQLKEII